MQHKIKKEQKDEFIKLVDKISNGKPYLFHEKELSKNEVEITIIASSFSPSQITELENIDLNNLTVMNKGKASESFSIFDD